MVTSIQNNKLVRIHISGDPDSYWYSGYLITESSTLVSIHRFWDFFLDGYGVYKKDKISSMFTRKSDRFIDSVVKSENLQKKSPYCKYAMMTSEDEFLEAARNDEIALVAHYIDEEGGDRMNIGRVIGIKRRTFTMTVITALGITRKRCMRLKKDGVYGYVFGDRYSIFYAKHAK